jgi:hypothetical protein
VDFSEKADRPAHSSFYTVAGRSLCVSATDEWAAQLFRTFFSGWHVSHRTDTPEGFRPDASIEVRSDPEPPQIPYDFESFEVASGGRCHTDGRTYFFEIGGNLIRVGTGRAPLAEVWFDEGRPAHLTNGLARLVFNATTAALRRCGLFELHGGGVVEPSTGGGALFIGPSGSGKSTITMQLAASGWQYLSDDTLLLSAGESSVEAWALRRAFAVTEPTLNASGLPSLQTAPTNPVPFDPLKRRFEPQTLFPGGFSESCTPRALFFPVVTREPSTRAQRLTQTETMARLLRMCPWSCYDRPVAREHLGLLSRLSRHCVAFDLQAGLDLMSDAGRTANLLAALMNGETV